MFATICSVDRIYPALGFWFLVFGLRVDSDSFREFKEICSYYLFLGILFISHCALKFYRLLSRSIKPTTISLSHVVFSDNAHVLFLRFRNLPTRFRTDSTELLSMYRLVITKNFRPRFRINNFQIGFSHRLVFSLLTKHVFLFPTNGY